MRPITITVRNFREQAYVDRHNRMMEQLRRKTMERGDSAYSEYIIFVGALAAVAEDATVEALKYFVPGPKEKKAIKELPKQQRKAYLKDHWPYYHNELKQMMESIDVSFFEKTAIKSANMLDREILQGVMDSAQEKLKRHVYMLRQAVKRAMGRVKDKNGQHMQMIEEKSYLYVATMLWMRVCACHDLRIKMGPTPVGEDRDEEVKQYMAEWTRRNKELADEGKDTLPSRYYSANFETAMLPFRPTRINDMMLKLCSKIIGWWANTKDPLNKDIPKCDDIIMEKAMSMNFMEQVTRSGIEDVERYKVEVEWIDRYVDETHDNIPLSLPMLNCVTVRLAGKVSTDHILEWLLRKNSNVGPNMFQDIKRVIMWLDSKLPPVAESEHPLTDEEKLRKVAELIHSSDRPTALAGEIEKLGDDTLTLAYKECIKDIKDVYASRREEELLNKQKQAAFDAMIRGSVEEQSLQLEAQPSEPYIKRIRWKDDDAAWLYSVISRDEMTYAEAAERLGRTEASCHKKYSRMKASKEKDRRTKNPLKITKVS